MKQEAEDTPAVDANRMGNDRLQAVRSLVERLRNGGTHRRGRLDRFAYRRFSQFFRTHKEQLKPFRQTVIRARLDESYDQYLARALLYTIVASGVGLLAGTLFGVAFAGAGVFEGIESQVRLPGSIGGFLGANKNLLGLLATMGGLTLATAIPTALFFYHLPAYRAYERRRAINLLLPQATTYMFAMARGGMTTVAIIRQLASDTETYGEVAESFATIVADMDYFGSDLRSALREARETTPSAEFAELLDDIISLIESGGELTPFLRSKTERHRRDADRRKESFLELLGQAAEMYVITMVIGLLLLITIIVIMTTIAGGGLLRLYLLIYLGLPLGSLAFIIIVDSVTVTDTKTTSTLPAEATRPAIDDLEAVLAPEATAQFDPGAAVSTDGGGPASASLSTTDEQNLRRLIRAKKRERLRTTLEAPIALMRQQPAYSLVGSVPLALLLSGIFAVTGVAVPTADSLITRPVWTTTMSFVLPLIVVLAPLAFFHEHERYHQRRVNRELPQVLKKVASANETGLTLARSLALVGQTSDGYLATELRRVDRELSEWNVSSDEALIRFANRVRNPRLTRVVKLLSEAASSSSNVREILEVAAADVETAYDLDRDRINQMISYLFFTLLGNVVFLGIIVLLQTQLLTQMAAATVEGSSVGVGTPLSIFSGLNFDELRMLFFHAVLLQAFFSGFTGGKFGEGSVYSGAKYSLVQLTVAVAVFWVI